MSAALLDVHALRQTFPRADGGELLVLDGIELQLDAGPDRRAARPHRVGQVDAAAPDRRPGAGRPAEPITYLGEPVVGPAPGHRHGVPVLRAVSLADGARKRAARARGARAAGRRDPPARARGDRSDRARRLRIRLSARAFRRHAPARRLCPRARRPSQHSADGRAVLGARRAHGGNPAHRFPRAVGRRQAADQGRHHRHPQHRGSGADVRPHPSVLDQSRTHHSRDRGRSASSRATASIRNSATWSRKSTWR